MSESGEVRTRDLLNTKEIRANYYTRIVIIIEVKESFKESFLAFAAACGASPFITLSPSYPTNSLQAVSRGFMGRREAMRLRALRQLQLQREAAAAAAAAAAALVLERCARGLFGRKKAREMCRMRDLFEALDRAAVRIQASLPFPALAALGLRGLRMGVGEDG